MAYYYQHNEFYDLYIPNPIGGVNWGTGTYALEFSIMIGGSPSRLNNPCILGSITTTKAGSSLRFNSDGSFSVIVKQTSTNTTNEIYRSPRGFLIQDWNFHTYRIEHFANGVYNFIRDGVIFATGKFTTDWYSSLEAGFDFVFRAFSQTTQANNFKYIRTEGFEVNGNWDSSLFTGTNTVIPSVSGTNDILYRQASNNAQFNIPSSNWRTIVESTGEYYLDLPTNGAYLTHDNIVVNYLSNLSIRFKLLINPEDPTGILTLWSNSTNNNASIHCDTSDGVFYVKRTNTVTLFNSASGFILRDGIPHTYEIFSSYTSQTFIRDGQVVQTATFTTGNFSDTFNTMLKSNQGFSQARTRLFFMEINGAAVTLNSMNQWNAAYSTSSNQLKTVSGNNPATQIGTWPSDNSEWVEYIRPPIVGTRFYLNKPSAAWSTSGYLSFRDEVRGNAGDKPFSIEFSLAINPTDTGKITLLSSATSGKGELTLNNIGSDSLNNIVLKLGMSNIGTITFATSANGILLRDGEFHTYKFEHDYNNNCTFYRDGVQVGTPTNYTTINGITSGGGFSQLLRSADGTDNGNVRLEYIKIVGLDYADEFNANYAKQSGSVLPAKQSVEPPYQVLDWPSDNSEWVSIGSALVLTMNKSTLPIFYPLISQSVGISRVINKDTFTQNNKALTISTGKILVINKSSGGVVGKQLAKLESVSFIKSIYTGLLMVDGKTVDPVSSVNLSKTSLTISTVTQQIDVEAGIAAYTNMATGVLSIVGKPAVMLCGNDLTLSKQVFTPLVKNLDITLKYGVIPVEQVFGLTYKRKFTNLSTRKQFFELTDK